MNTFGFRPGDDTGACVSILISLFFVGMVAISALMAAATRDAERRGLPVEVVEALR